MKPKFNFWLEKDGEVTLSISTLTFDATSTTSAKSPSPPTPLSGDANMINETIPGRG